MSVNPSTMNESCLNKYTSVFPLYILYASEPVALYTTSNDVIASSTTMPQMYLSPREPPQTPPIEGLSNSFSFLFSILFSPPNITFYLKLLLCPNSPPLEELEGAVVHNAFTASLNCLPRSS